MLFLDNHVGIYDQAEMPLSLTQSGIANALEIRRSQVSQVIGGLVGDDLVSGELRHVHGGKRRRICYFLTPHGMDRARQIEARIGEEPIELESAPGETANVKLREIPDIVGDGSTLLDIVTHTRKSRFDLNDYRKKTVQKRRIVTSKLPKLRKFYGRQEELGIVQNFLDSKDLRILAIRGIAGIGKSTLAAKVMKESKKRTNVFYYQLKDWTTVRGLLQSLSKLLSELDRNDLKFYLDSKKEIDLDEVGLVLEECLRGLDGIIVVDDCQFAEGEVLNFLESAREFLGASNLFKMIALGRRIPPFYDRRDVTVRKTVSELELCGLGDSECRELLLDRDIPASDFDEIIRRTEGHPLFLELVESPVRLDSGDIGRFLRQEIASKLSERESEILAFASVFRRPVSTSALFIDQRMDRKLMDSLVFQSLLTEVDAGRYVIHDALREYFYSELAESPKKEFHSRAGEYYSDFSDSESVLEAQYHLSEGGLFGRAAELLTLHGERLISEGFAENLLEMLTDVGNPEVWGPFATDVLLLRGRILNLAGKWKEAIEDFKEVGRLSDEEESGTALEAASQIGEIIRKQGKNDEALEILKEAERHIDERTDIAVTTRIFKNFAMIYAAQTDFESSYRYLSLMDEMTSGQPTESERSDYLAAKGSVLLLQNLHEEAMEAWKQALEICESNHDVLRLHTLYNGLGIVLYDLEKNDLALEYFDRAIKFAQRIGDLRSQGSLLLNTASIYIEKPSLSRAEKYLDGAEDIFDRLEEKRSSALVELSRAFISYRRGEYADACDHIQRHLAGIQKHGALTDMIYSFETSAELFKEMGMTAEERKCVETVVSLSEHVRDSAATDSHPGRPEKAAKSSRQFS